jgi:hypothetical protein
MRRRKNPCVSLAAGVAGSLLVIGGCHADVEAGPRDQPASGPNDVVLDGSLSALEADFNAQAGKVRLLFIIGPTCGPCLRGLDDMNDALGDIVRNDSRSMFQRSARGKSTSDRPPDCSTAPMSDTIGTRTENPATPFGKRLIWRWAVGAFSLETSG